MPVLTLWGKQGVVNRLFNCLEDWREVASDVRGKALDVPVLSPLFGRRRGWGRIPRTPRRAASPPGCRSRHRGYPEPRTAAKKCGRPSSS
mgnify:CR=1 FL=1